MGDEISPRLTLTPLLDLRNQYVDEFPWPKNYKYKIVFIQMNLQQDDLITKKCNGFNLREIAPEKLDELKDVFVTLSEFALEKLKAKVVVFSELSYPILAHSSLCEELYKLCAQNKALIIGGSFHETRNDGGSYRRYNICPIFNFLNETPLYQIKNYPGKYMNEWERIDVPEIKNLRIFYTRYGRFAIPICADILDKNLQNNVRVTNQVYGLYHPIDFLVVPSFTEKPWILSGTIKDFSRLSNTTILYINNHADLMPPEIFVSGNKKQIKGPIRNPCGVISQRIYTCDVDLAEIRKCRLLKENVSIDEYGELKS